MTEIELHNYLKKNFPYENEKCEWKEFKNLKHCISGNAGDDVLSYISAISNMNGGNLIIGIEDKTLAIIGVRDFHNYNTVNIKLKILQECPNLSSENFEITEIETIDTLKKIWIFDIPKHQYRLPVYAHKKAWQRINDSLVEITKSRLDSILSEVRVNEDWSSVILTDASISDLDLNAIEKAKIEFIKRNPKYNNEINSWDTPKFLDKAKLTIKGKITRTALILLGKEECEHLLGSTVKIRWNLKTIENEDKDFEVFSIPFILNVEEVYKKIRNLKYRYLRDGSLFPEEILRYDPFNIREPLNNAIAHQDYSKGARINVIEFEDDHLVFTNYGTFLPKSLENVVLNDSPEEVYRNPFLVEAMKNLDMIETQGGGIRKIFNNQKQRFFPMPEYDFDDGKVKVTITGKILIDDFARIIINNPKLTLRDVLLLDKIQKNKSVSRDEFYFLKKMNFIEGRWPKNLYLSFKITEQINDPKLKAEYIANKSFNDDYFKDTILAYIKKYKSAKRKDIDNLVIPKLSNILTEKQKKDKVTNFLTSLRITRKIERVGFSEWIILKNS